MSLVDGGIAQLRVIHAVALRETRTRFGDHRLGYLWALLEPAIWILTFYAAFSVMGRVMPNGIGIVPFLATGIVPYELWAKSVDRGSQAIAGNRSLLFYPHVHTLDLILARGALEFATYCVVFVVILGGYALVVGHWAIDSLLHTLLGLVLASLLGSCLGLVLCALGVISSSVDRIRGPLMRPMFWISGLFFTANDLPSAAANILLWNPVLHCVELVREGWFPSYDSRYAEPAYVLYWIVGLAFVGLTLERVVRRRVQLS